MFQGIDSATMTRKTTPIAAILPTYNEAHHIHAVLDVLREVDTLSEIIVVDVGSSDDTAELARQAAALDPRLQVIQHNKNRGKGQAIFTGWRATQAACLLLLDADLVNLTPQHVDALIAPVITRRADMTLGLFRGGRIHTDFAHWAAPWLTGQRCLRAEILRHVSEQAASGYGFEVALTLAAQRRGYRLRIIPLGGVWHPPSEFHRGWLKGIPWRLKMYGQILRAFWITSGWSERRQGWPTTLKKISLTKVTDSHAEG